MQIEEFIRQIALDNAIKFNGKANPKSLIGHIMPKYPDAKKDMKGLMQQINTIVQEVNNLSIEEQQTQLEQLGPVEKKVKEQPKDGLKELSNTENGVVMRFAPSVSAPHMHIGHAITGGLTSLYCRKYNGKFIFRMEDTNSDKIEQEAYTLFPQEAEWIFGNVTEVIVQSDRLEIYYNYAKKLFDSHHLYVCTCSQEAFKECATQKQACPCKSQTDHKERFAKMFDKEHGYKEGEAVVRFNGDMQHKNPAMRDFPLFRINDTPHSKVGTKYRVWPLMNFSVFVDDLESGMTHIIRAKEHMDNAKRQELLYAAVGKQPPLCYFTGRYNIEGLEISKTKTKLAIDEGKYTGWDDIRLPYLGPLRRRGYQPGAFHEFSRSVGLSQVDKTITADDFFKLLNAFNKQIIDPIANRFFFIENKEQITLNITKDVALDLHPTNKKGGRTLSVVNSVYLEKEDMDKFANGALVRLADFVNIKQDGDAYVVVSESYEDYKNETNKGGIIHWLPTDNLVNVTILMPDNTTKTGVAEKTTTITNVDDVVQFERFGFCRLDNKDEKMHFWFGHK